LFAVWAVDSLYYLGDVDRALDPSQATIGDHVADVVDVAHARWATGTCITALDLCAAALGRAFCAHTGTRELDIGNFDPERAPKRAARRRANLPVQAQLWIDNVLKDRDYRQIKAARDSLTHKRIPRHLTCPRQRLRLQVEDNQLDVPTVIDRAKDVASKHVSLLLAILPQLLAKMHGVVPHMTPDQEQQFDQFGCVPRCIIELAKTKGHPITDDEFCARFDYLFPNRHNQYGMLLTSQIAEVIKSLGLGRYFLTFRRYPAIVSRFGQGQRDILVLSEIDLYGNNENDHCSLLKEIDDQHFRLWTPLRGETHDERVLEAKVWDEKACHGVVLQP
jgi:hypothetical protein